MVVQATAQLLKELPLFKQVHQVLSEASNHTAISALASCQNLPAIAWAPVLQPWLVGGVSIEPLTVALNVLRRGTVIDPEAVATLVAGLFTRLNDFTSEVAG